MKRKKWKYKVRAALAALRAGNDKNAQDILVRCLSGEAITVLGTPKKIDAPFTIHRSGGGHGSKR